LPVAERAHAARRGEELTRRVVRDDCGQHAVAVERAERRRPVRELVRAVRGAVDRVEHDGELGVAARGDPGLFAHDRHGYARENAQRDLVGDEIERVLTRAIGLAPALVGGQRLHGGRDLARDAFEYGDELGWIHDAGVSHALPRRP
jgi:hypothetical protein